MRFAPAEASDLTLLRAAEANQRTWLTRVTQGAGGVVRRAGGMTWTVSPAGSAILFPRLPRAEADALLDAVLDEAVDVGANGVSCWSALPTRPPDLGDRLVARGFEWGWQPNWMTARLDALPSVATATGIVVEPVERLADWGATDLPYHDPSTTVGPALTALRPRRVWQLAAFRGSRAIGHAALSVTVGAAGVAGMYDVGVAPDERRRGVATALTLAAGRIARELGCEHATLNATWEGERLYRALGFRHVGLGQTWWMHAPGVQAWRRRREGC